MMELPGAKRLSWWIVVFVVLTNAVYAGTQFECTALVSDNCCCDGCSSFRAQKKTLICPPLAPDEVTFPRNRDASDGIRDPNGLPPIVEIKPDGRIGPVEPSVESADSPADRSATDTDQASDPRSPFEFEPPRSFAEQVPFGTAQEDQSTADPIPLASSDSGNLSLGNNNSVGSSGPSASQFAGAFGDSASQAGIPAMLGDFCGLGSAPIGTPIEDYLQFEGFGYGNGDIDSPGTNGQVPSTRGNRRRPVTTPVAGGDCRYKFAEFTSPIPSDRVFFSYHHYNNGLRDIFQQQGDVDLFTLGMEKKFWNGLASIETRLSMLGGGLNSTQVVGDTFGSELGSAATSYKGLLWYNRQLAVSGGVTAIWPTGDDGVIPGLMTIENESVHVLPFLAMVYTPNRIWFHQANIQFDFDANGNTVTGVNGAQDVIQNQTFMYLDYSVGRWFYQNRCGFIRRMAGVTELHYSTNLNDADVGRQRLFADIDYNVLNLTAGLHLQLRNATTFRVAGGAPLRTNGDRAFDSEISVQLSRFF